MEPLNVLVADLTHTSAFFVRSLLRAAGHRVSLALRPDEALAKVETGLFDVVYVDGDPGDAGTRALCAGLTERAPGLPLLLCTEPGRAAPPGGDVFAVLVKPLRLGRVIGALRQAAMHLQRLREQRRFMRRTVDLKVEVWLGASRVQARAVNLSLGGMQIDAGGGAEAWRLVARAGTSLAARVFLEDAASDGAALEVPARLAYVDAEGASDQVGLAFRAVPEGTRARLERFLTAAA